MVISNQILRGFVTMRGIIAVESTRSVNMIVVIAGCGLSDTVW